MSEPSAPPDTPTPSQPQPPPPPPPTHEGAPSHKMTKYGAIETDEDETSPLPQLTTPIASPGRQSNASKLRASLLASLSPATKRRRTREEKVLYENNIKAFVDALLSNSSLLAISNVVKRNHPVLKTLWAIALFLCLILSIRQLYSLTVTFIDHPKSTTIELSYKPYEFPSVTVCNHNPLRRSRVPLFGQPALNRFFSDLLTKNYSVADNGTQLMTQQSDWLQFYTLISNHSIAERNSMGYQISDFVLQCNFAGKKCDPAMFSVSLSRTYGNCFTFNGWRDAKSLARPLAKNGREHGLIMTLFLELEEYLQNFIPTAGVKIQLHEPGSMAFPEYSGFSVPPGFQSSIGVSLKQISRLDHPNDHCEYGNAFAAKYGIKYTFSACMAHCKHAAVRTRCQCYDRANILFYSGFTDRMQACQTEEQLSCMMQAEYMGEEGDLNCGCQLPCFESYYLYRHSLSEWPTDSYEARLFGDLIDVKPKIGSLKNQSKLLARRNLLNLLVYTDGLMTEHVIEKNAYVLDNFLSDIGGTLGLFLGFSVLTGFELLEALALLTAYVCGKIIYRDDVDQDATNSSPEISPPPSPPRIRRASRLTSLSSPLHPG